MWYVTFWNANYGAQVGGGEGRLNQTMCLYEKKVYNNETNIKYEEQKTHLDGSVFVSLHILIFNFPFFLPLKLYFCVFLKFVFFLFPFGFTIFCF